jgi:hypothetical protein
MSLGKWHSYPDAPGGHYQRDWNRVVERQDHRCAICGVDDRLFQSKRIPISRGGTNYAGNLIGLCWDCKIKKRGKTLMELRMKEIRAQRLYELISTPGVNVREVLGLPAEPTVKARFRKRLGIVEYGKAKGFLRPDGRAVYASDPDGCTCKKQGAHILGSPVCWEAPAK